MQWGWVGYTMGSIILASPTVGKLFNQCNSAIWWPNFQPMQVAPSGSDSTQFEKKWLENISQIMDSIPWVCCASCNVFQFFLNCFLHVFFLFQFSLALVPILATMWRYWNWLPMLPPDDTTCISCRFGQQLALLESIASLATKWISFNFGHQVAPLALLHCLGLPIDIISWYWVAILISQSHIN